ncbi:unnamed protein product [Agarophyton chilense]
MNVRCPNVLYVRTSRTCSASELQAITSGNIELIFSLHNDNQTPFKLSTFRIRYGKIRDERRKNRKVFPSLSQEIQQKMTTKIVLKPAIMISIWRTRNLEIMKTNTKAVLHKKCFDLLFYTQFGKMRSPPCRFSA